MQDTDDAILITPNTLEAHALLSIARDRKSETRRLLSLMDDNQLYALLESAATHRTLPLLVEAALETDLKDTGIGTMLRRLMGHYKITSSLRHCEYGRLLENLYARNLKPVVVKGYWLAGNAYRSPWLREYNDLDILLSECELPAAVNILRENGYDQVEYGADNVARPLSTERLTGYRRELQHLGEFVKMDSTTLTHRVDVHFRFNTAFDHIAPDAQRILNDAVPHPGDEPAYLIPASADLINHLCYHAWWDTQSVDNVRKGRDLRLFQYVDIYLACHQLNIDAELIIDRANTLGCQETAHYGLDMATRLIGPVPGDNRAIDREIGYRLGNAFADRWVQRTTSQPFAYWDTPAYERIFDNSRQSRACTLFFKRHINARLRSGDIMTWTER